MMKDENELRCRVVAHGCFKQTPSLVTMRWLLGMATARNWGIKLGDISTAFWHAGDVFAWPPKEVYPEGRCLWRLKTSMYGLRQAPEIMARTLCRGSDLTQKSVWNIVCVGMCR